MMNTQTAKNHEWQPRSMDPGFIMSNLIEKFAAEEDHGAFQEFFVHFGPRVKSYLIKHGVDHATAEELMQETMMTVWRKSAMFDASRGSVQSWVFTIARNLRIDRLRRERSWQELSDEHLEKSSEELPVDEVVSQNQIVAKIRAILKELPDEQRKIIELSYLKGLSQSDISTELQLPLGTVKSRMRLAYNKIRLSVEDLK